ncbi:MAG: hypothetical protein ABI994_10450, partial [Gemmatimonadales bacterium]
NKARIAGVFYLITFVAGSASVGWLTFISPTLSHSLYPYDLAPGIIGEGALTLWLLVVGLNEQRWKEQEAAAA